jgi:hypothetical protein
VADPRTAFDLNGLLDELKKEFAERVLNAEMDHHPATEESGNSRNGYGKTSFTRSAHGGVGNPDRDEGTRSCGRTKEQCVGGGAPVVTRSASR